MKPPRILLVYGYEPSGHSAAAFALEEALRVRGALVSRVEVATSHHPAAGLAVARGYHALLRAFPGLWGGLYASRRARATLRAVRAGYLALGGASRLRAGVSREAPDLVVCPQAAVAAVFAQARRSGGLAVPVASVLTDLCAHPFWADPSADLVLAPEAAVGALSALGVPSARIRVTGIPIHPAFAAAPSREEARRMLALPAAAPVALLTGGGKGLGGISRAARRLLALSPRATLLVFCGRNEALRRSLSREGGERLRVFGPQPAAFVALAMAAADLHLGKPGGLSAAESLASGLPMVLPGAMPGQEEGNARFLVALGAGELCDGPREAAEAAARLFLEPERLAEMRASALSAGRPRAAFAAAEEVLSFARLTALSRSCYNA